MSFNPERLELALRRRRTTARSLAEAIGISTVSLSRIRKGGHGPAPETVERIASVLDYPVAFFHGVDIGLLDEAAVSFRSLSGMTGRERHAAMAAGALACLVSDWLDDHYNLPDADLVDFAQERDPETAARGLRQHWGLGEQPIGDLVQLLESRGVRVFSLAENTRNVDAFSFWRDDRPFVFLNTVKTAERSRFDAAHELGHLVLHRHGASSGSEAESEANAFASSFLMPHIDVLARLPRASSLTTIIAAKKRWRVSAAALVRRLHGLRVLSDWQYRTFNIQLRQTYGVEEPDPGSREVSRVWRYVLDDLWKAGRSRNHLAAELHIPHEELETILFGITAVHDQAERSSGRPKLSLVV